ncbi:MAG: outer membrane lipoprotein carrier protein LolA [Sphingomicrobium sp.]
MSFATTVTRAFIPAAMMLAAPALAAQSADMALLGSHLTAVKTLSADFSQTDARGRSATGTLQLKRPGKVRFAYSSGDLLLVADGSKLTFVDYQVGQKSSWPLSKTPLGVLLSDSPNLKGKAQIMPSTDPNVLIVRARDPAQYGSLTLAFLRSGSAPGGLQLYGWTATDAQNKRTTVKLTNVRYNVAVPESAFSYDEPKKKGR